MDMGVDGKSGDAKCLGQYDASGLMPDAREGLKRLKRVGNDALMTLDK